MIGKRGGIPFSEAQHLILELLRETGSHVYADLVGLDLVGSQADIATIRVAQDVADVLRKDTDRFHLPSPWLPADPNADVTPDERAELNERLDAVSPFAGR